VYPGPGDIVPNQVANGRGLATEDEDEAYEAQWADFYDNEEADFDHFTLEEFEAVFGEAEGKMALETDEGQEDEEDLQLQ
jgi:hypothetical protein